VKGQKIFPVLILGATVHLQIPLFQKINTTWSMSSLKDISILMNKARNFSNNYVDQQIFQWE